MLSTEENLTLLKAAQNPDGGFGFMPRTTFFLRTPTMQSKFFSYFNRLEGKVSKGAQNFVMSCLNADFGFGRNSKGIFFLNPTYFGLPNVIILLRDGNP